MSQNADQAFYDEIDRLDGADLKNFSAKIKSYVDRYQDVLQKKFQNQGISVLELGAGSCTASLAYSSLDITKQIICADISIRRMEYCVPKVAPFVIGCKPEKLSFLQCDFSHSIDVDDATVDVIVFDASLHHTRSMWLTLEECFRVLKPNGLLVAQREQYLGLLTYALKLEQLLLTPEVLSGVSENAYLRKQYEYYMRANGFQPQFIAAPETFLQKLLFPLNGLVWSKWIIVAEKQKWFSVAQSE